MIQYMYGNIFQTLAKSGNRRQFTKTVEALELYYNKKLRFTGDLKSLYQDLTLPILVEPPDISSTEAKNAAKLLVWQEKKKSFLKNNKYWKTSSGTFFR